MRAALAELSQPVEDVTSGSHGTTRATLQRIVIAMHRAPQRLSAGWTFHGEVSDRGQPDLKALRASLSTNDALAALCVAVDGHDANIVFAGPR